MNRAPSSVLCLALAACWSSRPPAAPAPEPAAAPASRPPAAPAPETLFETALATLNGFADEVCACTDKACAEHVMAAMSEWSNEMANNPEVTAEKPDDAMMEQMTAFGQRYAECLTKVMSQP